MTKPEWILTEGQIVKYASIEDEQASYCQLSINVGEWATKETAKGILKWLVEPCQNHREYDHFSTSGKRTPIIRKYCPKCMEQFEKEVEKL